jgi:molybdate transport repressor ModE-like protein
METIMELTLRHVTVLCAVEEEGSITRAASRLGVSQPALTAQLQRIERELGQPVFTRSTHGVAVTRTGRRVMSHAQAAQAAMSRLREDAHSLRPGATVVRVGGHGPLLLTLVDRLAQQGGPQTSVTTRAERSSRLLQSELEQDKIDYAVLREYPGHELSLPAGIVEYELVADEPLFVGMTRGHRLAAQDVIGLDELRDEPWATDPDDDSGENTLLQAACARAGFEPRFGLISSDGAAARSYVGAGRAVALFDARARQDDRLVVRPLRGDPLRCRLALRWRRDADLALAPGVVSATLTAVYQQAVAAQPVYSRWRAGRG